MAVAGLTFQVLTAIEIPWKAAVRGGVITATLGSAAAAAVGVYLAQAGSTGTLGALGSVAILLVFFNVMWVVYLFGAEITKVYADYLTDGEVAHPSTRQPVPPEASGSRPPPRGEDRPGLVSLLTGIVIGWLAGRRGRTRPR
jgi:uncharacterized BrkB/YihY/UPF0761 family membrane protein